MWKVLEGIVPNPNGKIISSTSPRRGRMCRIPVVKSTGKIQSIHGASFPVNGAQLFNAMPKEIRNLSNVSLKRFKSALDKYMAQIPDEPQICGYTASRRADNNSILEMKKYASSVADFVVFQSQSYRGGELHNQQA